MSNILYAKHVVQCCTHSMFCHVGRTPHSANFKWPISISCIFHYHVVPYCTHRLNPRQSAYLALSVWSAFCARHHKHNATLFFCIEALLMQIFDANMLQGILLQWKPTFKMIKKIMKFGFQYHSELKCLKLILKKNLAGTSQRKAANILVSWRHCTVLSWCKLKIKDP